jgi:hypothetical protein
MNRDDKSCSRAVANSVEPKCKGKGKTIVRTLDNDFSDLPLLRIDSNSWRGCKTPTDSRMQSVRVMQLEPSERENSREEPANSH